MYRRFLSSFFVVFDKKVKCIEQTEDDRHFSSYNKRLIFGKGDQFLVFLMNDVLMDVKKIIF